MDAGTRNRKVHFCPRGRNVCNEACAVLSYASGQNLDRALAHVQVFQHARVECRHGEACYRFVRYKDRANQAPTVQLTEQQKYDEAHCRLYHHGVDLKLFEDPSFNFFTPIPPPPQGIPSPNGFLGLENEVQGNGFGYLLSSVNERSILDIARDKGNHPIHVALGKPLNSTEILAVLLYTGTRIQPDFSESHRERNFSKWWNMRRHLQSAIERLHHCKELTYVWKYKASIGTAFAGQRVRDDVLKTWQQPDSNSCSFKYSHNAGGVQGTVTIGERTYDVMRVAPSALDDISHPQVPIPSTLWRGIRKTRMQPGEVPHGFEYYDYLSTSASKKVVEDTFLGHSGCEGILFAFERDEGAACADVSWISKFEDEQEILFAPTRWELQANVAYNEGQRRYIFARYMLSSMPCLW